MSTFVDRLQTIHPNLPLRLVPLRIEEFGVVVPRVREEHRRALAVQEDAVRAWNTELAARFSEHERQTSMPAVPLRK